MSEFLYGAYKSLKEYIPGEQPRERKYVKLNTNESPYPPSDGVRKAINTVSDSLMLYCDPECTELKKELAAYYNVEPQNVFVSNGSDDILNFAFMAYSRVSGVVFPEISYGFYRVFADLYGAERVTPPLREDFSLDVNDYIGTGKMIVIANPNAPTGRMLGEDDIERIVSSNRGHPVVIDEAYVDFGGKSCYNLIRKYKNLCICMTYSKSRSLAGARLGFAIADREIISDFSRLANSTNPYSVNTMTQAAGIAALRDADYYHENCRKIIMSRERLAEELRSLGFTVIPSGANFVFAASDKLDGRSVYLGLRRLGVLVRHFDDEKICNYNRITVGTDAQVDILLSAIKQLLSELNGGKKP